MEKIVDVGTAQAGSVPAETDSKEPAVVLTGVSKSYPGVKALSDVNFDCRPGEVHALVGENGSGKSTLIKIASGVLTHDTGEVTIGGQALAGGISETRPQARAHDRLPGHIPG